MKISMKFIVPVFILFTSCGKNEHKEEQRYDLLTIAPISIEIKEEYTASIKGRQDVDVYPQVSGTITKLCVNEGQKVHKGEVLFIIDQVPYQAALRTALANVHAAEAQLENARLEYRSKSELYKEDVISEYDLSVTKNGLAAAEATLEQMKAQEISARNNLSYTEIKSPSDGVVGTLPYRVGALVSPTIPQPLTVVSDNAQMFVYFSMSENQLRSLLRKYGSTEKIIAEMPEVELRLNDGIVHEIKGKIASISGIINSNTGTASVKCVFPNDRQNLISGSIGNVIIPQVIERTIVIPQEATYEIQDKVMAYKIVDNKAISSELKVHKLNDGKSYIVTDGLSVGDVIVSKGVGLITDGQEIVMNNNPTK